MLFVLVCGVSMHALLKCDRSDYQYLYPMRLQVYYASTAAAVAARLLKLYSTNAASVELTYACTDSYYTVCVHYFSAHTGCYKCTEQHAAS